MARAWSLEQLAEHLGYLEARAVWEAQEYDKADREATTEANIQAPAGAPSAPARASGSNTNGPTMRWIWPQNNQKR